MKLSLRRKVAIVVPLGVASYWGFQMATASPPPTWVPEWLIPILGLASSVVLVLVAILAIWIVVDIVRQHFSAKDTRSIPFWVPMWRLVRNDRWPIRFLIPLHRAVILAYPKIRGRADVATLEALDNNDPAKIPRIVAQMLLNQPGFDFPIYGTFPPSETFQEIPENDRKSFGFSGDAKEMFDQFSAHGNNRRYTKLAIKRSDLKRRLQELGP